LIYPTIAYPPADKEVCGYLLPNRGERNDELVVRYISFLSAMFDVAEPIVRGWKLYTHSEIAKKWHDYLSEGQESRQNRKTFYRNVVIRAKVFAPMRALLH
jgi:hypothetical protein